MDKYGTKYVETITVTMWRHLHTSEKVKKFT